MIPPLRFQLLPSAFRLGSKLPRNLPAFWDRPGALLFPVLDSGKSVICTTISLQRQPPRGLLCVSRPLRRSNSRCACSGFPLHIGPPVALIHTPISCMVAPGTKRLGKVILCELNDMLDGMCLRPLSRSERVDNPVTHSSPSAMPSKMHCGRTKMVAHRPRAALDHGCSFALSLFRIDPRPEPCRRFCLRPSHKQTPHSDIIRWSSTKLMKVSDEYVLTSSPHMYYSTSQGVINIKHPTLSPPARGGLAQP